MRSLLVASLLATAASPAWALGPWSYPGRYGGWGWGGWGNSPGGLMAGMGMFARGEGTYFKDIQQAGERESKDLQEWNASLTRARRVQWAEFQKGQAAVQARAAAAADAQDVLDGTALNTLLFQIFEFDPDSRRAAAAQAPVSRDVVQDIPYEPATEAFTVCLDQLTGLDRWPTPLDDPRFDAARQAVVAAVDAALDADRKGPVPPAALKDLRAKVGALRAQYEKQVQVTDPSYLEGEAFLKSLAGLAGMLESPRLKVFLDELNAIDRPTTIGDLIGFMNAFNLKFGPAQTDRQRLIYRQLAPMLQQVSRDIGRDLPPPPADAAFDRSARQVFRNFSWQDLDAHARTGDAGQP
jgi:hypothetical protein